MKPFALQKETGSEDFADWQAIDTLQIGERDYCSREGAVALKEKIEAYWRDRGQNVLIALHNVGFHPAIRAARFDVRSDMVNGMPRAGASKKPMLKEVVADDCDGEDDDL